MASIKLSEEFLKREIFELTRIIDGSKWSLRHGKVADLDKALLRREIEKRSEIRARYQEQLDGLGAADARGGGGRLATPPITAARPARAPTTRE